MMYYSVNDTGILGKIKSECSYQKSNQRPSDYQFGCSTTELQETRGSLGLVQTPPHSCAEPNSFKFDSGTTWE